MSKLTPFGAALRKLRIDHEMRLFDLAEKIGKSTAMISAVETGRKPIPEGFIDIVTKALRLSETEIQQLASAKDKTSTEIKVGHLSPGGRELVAGFARQADELPDALLKELRKTFLKSLEGEIPFKRKRRGILVPPLSRNIIETLANNVRGFFGLTDISKLPIIEILEFGLPKIEAQYSFEIWDEQEMGRDEGRVLPGHHTIILRRDVYDAACNGDGRARFTAAHELGHYAMHHEISFARASSDNDPIYRDAEWQADTFAGFLMAPRALVKGFSSATEASDAFGISLHAANVMLAKHR
ncbi:helix-turn-helix domain-containing protein [Methylovirgula sp. 4M-Z18]|uniref:helix-turn-helix domain-containing protein n=1 Tax=Methylovirgula sp. 4M-Z18 TaxID=2293567 RepID=UPI000E2F2BB2|nr:XRE family transcriptional regulator [Methylovirgula sp. 4M-Z18]RFB78921.1 ImmA/IrrE family metallo-endopeptidase [Methylovirgula sp. 4M-Z18]